MSYVEKFWRDATVSDLVKVMESETVEARFADDGGNWVLSKLRGWRSSSRVLDNWIDDDGARWDYCQVYDPPQWFLDKPEPGEGYRLLEKFPDEALQPGDEFFANSQWWPILLDRQYPQDEGIWCRRKIEQPKPEPKYKIGQRVKVVGPNKQHSLNWCSELDQYRLLVAVVTKAEEADLQVAGKAWFYTVEGVIPWRFREDYLEPAVEPEPKHYTLQVGDTCDVPSGHRLAVTEHGVEVT